MPAQVPRPPRGSRRQAQRVATHVLERDGVVSGFFAALVKADAYRASRSVDAPAAAASAITIPDTVVYERDFPQGWYTFSQDEGRVTRHPGKMLDAATIVQHFRVPSRHTSIVAQFVTSADSGSPPTSPTGPAGPTGSGGKWPSNHSVASGTPRHAMETGTWGSEPFAAERARQLAESISGNRELSILYLDADDLEQLVFCRGRFAAFQKDGLLQRFVPPRASNNDCLQVVWSPRAAFVSRAVQRSSIEARTPDSRVSTATFDGPAYLSRVGPVNNAMRHALVSYSDALSKHLLRSEHKVISRLVLFFKQDPSGRLWMLFATSIRVADEEGAPTVRRPRLPLAMPVGRNFAHELRSDAGTSADALRAQLMRRVEFRDPLRPENPSRTTITYRSPSEQPTGSRSAYRVLRDVTRSPEIVRATIRPESPQVSLAVPEAPAPGRESLIAFLKNFAYELHARRSIPPTFVAANADSRKAKGLVVTVPRPVLEQMSESEAHAVFEETLGLIRVPDAAGQYRDPVIERMASAASSSTKWRDQMLAVADASRHSRAAEPLSVTIDRVERAITG